MAIGLPQRHPGVWRKLEWLSSFSELVPFFLPSVLTQPYAPQPQSLSVKEFHLSHCQSWRQVLPDSICHLPSLPSSFSILPLTSWSLTYPCLFLRELGRRGGRQTSGFLRYIEIGSCAPSRRMRLLESGEWEEGDGDAEAHQQLPAFPCPLALVLLPFLPPPLGSWTPAGNCREKFWTH